MANSTIKIQACHITCTWLNVGKLLLSKPLNMSVLFLDDYRISCHSVGGMSVFIIIKHNVATINL